MQLTFGEALLDLIRRRGLSATAVAEELGFKNKTAFFRILHDESRLPGIMKCFEAAQRSRMLALSDKEVARLREAVSLSELGRHAYQINAVLREMIYPQETQDKPQIAIEGIDGVGTLEELLSSLPADGVIRIALIGRCQKDILDRFHRLTQEKRIVEIAHLLAIDEDDAEDLKALAECSGILFSNVYSAYCLNETKRSRKTGWLRSSLIIIVCDHGDGTCTAVQLGLMGGNRYMGLLDRQSGLVRFYMGMYHSIADQLVPLKIKGDGYPPDAAPDLARYVDFTDAFRKLEQNRAIYMIKPDLPINCVPVDILAPMIIDGISSRSPSGDCPPDAQLDRLYAIHKSRVSNIYEKKKPTHIVLNVQAMMRFARTGQRSDHFFLGRPYTSEERAAILTLLRDQARDNPNFFVWFSASENIVSDREMTIYDGYGVAIVKADTSWHLEHDHHEIMLQGKMMNKYFKSYFTSSVLGKAVLPQEQTLALLEEMIKEARMS